MNWTRMKGLTIVELGHRNFLVAHVMVDVKFGRDECVPLCLHCEPAYENIVRTFVVTIETIIKPLLWFQVQFLIAWR